MLKHSVAVIALLASGSLAMAEPGDKGPKTGGAGGPGATMEHSPGAGAGAMPGGDHGPSKADSALPGKMSPGEKPSGDLKSGPAKGADATAPNASKDRSRSAEDRPRTKPSNGTAENGADRKANDKVGTTDVNKKAGASTGASEGTEGRSGTHVNVSITSDQRTKIGPIFSRHRVEPARNLNVSVNVGVALPRSVHLYPVPEEVVTIVPEYRSFEYILLDDNRIAIVDPATYEIVDIIAVA